MQEFKKIGILGDTHGYLESIDQILDLTAKDGISLWLHTGDYGDDARYMATKTDIPVVAVRGNNDRQLPLQPSEQLIPFEDTFIYMVHGDKFMPYHRTQEIIFLARKMGAKLAISGHSHHHGSHQTSDCLWVNPGSPSLPRDGSGGTFAVAAYDGKQFKVNFVYFKDVGQR